MFSKTNLFLCLSLAILLIVISSQADARETSKATAPITQEMNSNNTTDQKIPKRPKPGGNIFGKACKICPCKYQICSKCPKCDDQNIAGKFCKICSCKTQICSKCPKCHNQN
uniref:SAR8.2e protein n=1 Tax=Nicotiana tabacum TaxID=4097 RepID=Q40575_TOBAC|nr:mRNA inducible by salicylic acid or by TMVduring Systemic Acquired Resistance response.' [Nicotiana tabacum]